MNTQLLAALITGALTVVAGVTTVLLSTRSARRQNTDTLSVQVAQSRWREEGLLAGEKWKHYEWLAEQVEAKDKRIDELLEEVRTLRDMHHGAKIVRQGDVP